MSTLTNITNNPSKAGQWATPREFFGPFNRYSVYAVHTRFESVQWFVTDAEKPDELTGFSSVIRQTDSKDEAMKGLIGSGPKPSLIPVAMIDGVRCYNICHLDPECTLNYEDFTAAAMEFCETYQAAYYGADREDFSYHLAAEQARAEGKTRVICEDLS